MTTLVTGATGSVGRHLVAQLVQAGQPVRALTRRPAAADLPAGAEVVGGDLLAPDTLPAALRGVARMFLFAVPETAQTVVDHAVRAGVRRIVVLSSSAVDDSVADDAVGSFGHAHHRPVERAVERAGVAWTHLRAGEFMLNTLDWAPELRAEGVVRGVNGHFPSAPIHEADVASVAAAALLGDGHAGAKYFLTGPALITPVEQVRTIGAALGRALQFVELTPDQARDLWRRRGMPSEVIEHLLWSPPAPPADGGYAALVRVSPTVAEVTGRPARSYAEWVADHVADFR
ncbi:hydroxylase [Sorangium cellulosum]|uniref:Hydroxylase n=1 Tax=Sorangium cellulosum TaxID=56 RepID=A0A2L0EKL7_SORCE|nr:NAD(P)H-binding protein [Sorangium cellulosum]AUX39834.1 hydroxylase [Sorangium cellulosum]